MSPLYVLIALFLQGILINSEDAPTIETIEIKENFDVLPIVDEEPFIVSLNDKETENEEVVEDYSNGSQDFYDFLYGSNGKFSGPSASLMQEVTSDKSMPAEEQVNEIKRVANKISNCIESEMINFLSYITANFDKTEEGSSNRSKRDTESPMDCFKRVVRLLNHIKCTNEQQNLAIDKMMTAQEIAEKFNIEFHPEPEIFESIANSSKSKNDDIQAILNEVKPHRDVQESDHSKHHINYYHYNGDEVTEESPLKDKEPVYVHVPPQHLFPGPQCTYTFPQCETQVRPPPHHHSSSHPVSQRPPVFYEPQAQYTPAHYHPHHHEEPMFVEVDIIEVEDSEPELVAEEFEETISSRVFVGKGEEPGTATVNHVTTYTVSEKSHFKKPEIEALPEQIQYYFHLL